MIHPLRYGFALLLVTLLTACAGVRPWQNLPLSPDATLPTVRVAPDLDVSVVDDRSMVLAVTISGGGARAAAFGYGVLDAMRQTQLRWNGRDVTLLDELDVISGISGGQHHCCLLCRFWQKDFPGL